MGWSTWDSTSFEAASSQFPAPEARLPVPEARSQLPVPEDSSLTVGCLSGTATAVGADDAEGSCPQAGPRLPVAGENMHQYTMSCHILSAYPYSCLPL